MILMWANQLLGPFGRSGPLLWILPASKSIRYVPCHINNRYINSYYSFHWLRVTKDMISPGRGWREVLSWAWSRGRSWGLSCSPGTPRWEPSGAHSPRVSAGSPTHLYCERYPGITRLYYRCVIILRLLKWIRICPSSGPDQGFLLWHIRYFNDGFRQNFYKGAQSYWTNSWTWNHNTNFQLKNIKKSKKLYRTQHGRRS